LYSNIVGPLGGRETLNTGETQRAQIYAQKAVATAEQLAASDSTNIQARSDLAYAYTKMGDSLASRQPAAAREWYRKSIEVTKQLGPRSEAKRELAERDETLASVLTVRAEWPERLRLLQEANTIRQEMVRTGPNPPRDRVHLMRSYCRLSDAELDMKDVAGAKQYADSSVPFFKEFRAIAPSLVVLRDLGFCYESLGRVQRRAAMDGSLTPTEREAAAAASRDWYTRSAAVWNEWVKREAATPESEIERHKVEHLLGIQ
jgi:tetratricopeptide (TPR) repeat protein